MLTGENGILKQAQNAKLKTDEAHLKEKIELAISAARMGEDGLQELTIDNLSNELYKNNIEAIVSDNNDGSKKILLISEKKEYKLDNSGNLENQNIDFNTKYIAPNTQVEERNKDVIGIGTDGNVVNMDLWEYTLMDDNTFGLNDIDSLNTIKSIDASKGYLGDLTLNNGLIYGTLPQYISLDNGNSYNPVTNIKWLFYDCELKEMPILPTTIKNMDYAFRKCTNLEKVSIIPNSVISMYSSFMTCTNIIDAPKIPESVINMGGAFSGCTKLTNAPYIPQNVKILMYAFRECKNLQGIIEIDADIDENADIDNDGYVDYRWCFYEASTNEGITLTIKGKSKILDLIINTATSNNIKF